jgi:hypothetical protein
VEIDQAVVAVDIDRYGAENNEENDNDGPEKNKREKREASLPVAAAFFNMKPAMRAVAYGVGYLGFAFRTFEKRHGYNSCTPANSAK